MVAYSDSNEKILDLLMNTHFPVIKPMETGVNSTKTEQLPSKIDMTNNIISHHTIRWAVNAFTAFKSSSLIPR